MEKPTSRGSDGSTEALGPFLEAMPDGMVISGTDGRIVFVNALLEKLSGYSRAELVGQPIETLVPERLRATHEHHRERYYEAGLPPRAMGTGLEISLRRKDGDELPVDIALSPIQIGGKRLVVGAIRDATDRKRLEAELHRLAVLGDRERIGRELHDGAIQALFSTGMKLQAALATTPDEAMERMEQAIDEIDRVIGELRTYIFGLRPAIRKQGEPAETLARLAGELQEQAGVVPVVDVDPDAAAVLRPAGDLVQLVREALSNVARHAEATTCRLFVHRVRDDILVEIDDDGRGFDPAERFGAGQGLPNLHDRAAALGAKLEIESAPGRGTTVRVTVPA